MPGEIDYLLVDADPYFDPLWARVEEARIPVALQIGVSGYMQAFGPLWGEDPNVSEAQMSAFQWVTCFGRRPIMAMVPALVLHNLFGRLPRLQMLSIENGSSWIPRLLTDMDGAARHSVNTLGEASGRWLGGPITDAPSRLFREHFSVAPSFEQDEPALVQCIGAERVLFGSDWPHPEGLAAPRHFLREVEGLAPAQVRRILCENTAGLLGLAA